MQRGERLIVEPAVVEHLADVLVHERALLVERERAIEPALRLLEIAVRLLGQAELHDRADVVRRVLQDRVELRHGFLAVADRGVGAAELPARVAIIRVRAQLVAQLGDAAIVVAGVKVRDLEVALRHLHLRVELERARERGDRVLVHPLVVVEDTEVVVRAGIGAIDALRERPQNVAVALRDRRGRGSVSVHNTRTARRMTWSDAASGNSRKKPRSSSPSPCR